MNFAGITKILVEFQNRRLTGVKNLTCSDINNVYIIYYIMILNFEQFVNSPLYENNNNLSYDTFKHQLKKMGFKYRLGAGSRVIWDIPFNGSVYPFTTHLAKNAKADSIRILLNLLKEIGWLDVPENAKKVPWDSWQVKPKKYGL